MPSEYSTTLPVVFFLHGLGDNITRLDNEFHFQQVADDFGWMMVVPQALQQSGYTMWNAGMYSSSIDDSGFLMALLDSLAVQYPVNLDSVFFTGFSMGGFMTHRMAIEHGDRIAACAPVSGLITFSLSNLTPVAPVRMLHIHGTSDNVVGYNGSSQVFGGTLGLGVDDILNYWQNANGCEGEPKIDTLLDLHNDGLRFIRYAYDCGKELQHIKVVGGTHSWYHSDSQYDISYMNEIHDFFTKKEGNVSVAETEKNDFAVWPNPTSGLFNIKAKTAKTIEIIDAQGHTISKIQLHPGTVQIDLGNIPEGLYFIKDGNSATKLVLMR